MVIPGLSSLIERQSTAAPQYKDESYAPELLAIHGTFCGVAILSVLLRLYVRVFMLKSVGIDDYIIVAASVSLIQNIWKFNTSFGCLLFWKIC